ncbi:hypothetical protein [uncultured Bacteroides sp.]|jgi:hypothetical protein|uniref:hypothetical protein n=1 Tax=uncultured Bacteroides sp. TaxID=162156 RepID=UPI00280BC820|nr:hypothetical protein [uncultured Bacteroides sp.]
MKRVFKIIMLSIGWVFACWMLSACSSAMEEPDNGISNGSTATLTIHTAVPGAGTRADDNIPEREKIDYLRIIVVDKETNIVDYNRLHNFPNRDGSTYTIGLDKGGKKLLYLLANTENLPKLVIPSEGQDWRNNAIDDYVINPLPDDRLPFTSKYEVEVAEEEEEDTAGGETTEGDIPADGDGTTEGDTPADVVPEIPEDYTCYIAIAAVKFSFTFTNNTEQEITVSDFKISSIADCSYLLPRNDDWDKWVENVTGDGAKEYFTNYEIPSGAEHKEFTVPIPSSENDGETSTKTSTSSFTVPTGDNNTYLIPDFYCHESKYLPFPDVTEQHYTIHFSIGGKSYDAEIENNTESLKSLIRSTHVIVNININKLSEDGTHEIIVWGKITDWKDLKPVEGGLEEVES